MYKYYADKNYNTIEKQFLLINMAEGTCKLLI